MANREIPNSHKDPFWSGLAASVEQKLELPSGLLQSILLRGERSNADQVSEAGARTPFQIIPETRNAVIKKYGIDAYLSPENSAEAAGLLLKESLRRNKGDVGAAIAEYHGGTNRENWGAKTKAYVGRVSAGIGSSQDEMTGKSTFQRVMSASGSDSTRQISNIYNAYASGKMTQNEAAEFEADVKSGAIMLPRGASLLGEKSQKNPVFSGQTSELPAAVVDAYNTGKMSREEMIQLESDVKNGLIRAPSNMQLKKTEPLGVFGAIKESLTGSERETESTRSMQDWAAMPELNSFSMDSFKSALGTIATSPQETVQVIKSNFPGVQVSQDEKGNFLLRSSIDGKQYAIKPGLQPSDIPRAAGALLAFTPAGRATTLPGIAAASGATQAAIEATQAATGGNFDVGDIATSAAIAPAIPAVVKGVQTIKAARTPMQSALSSASTASTTEAAPVAMTSRELNAITKTAAEGGIGSGKATSILAEQAAPDKKVLEAARRLGIDEYLQPDHVTTNQAYRELAQAIKSIPGSQTRAAEIEGLNKVGQRADQLIVDIGGTTDISRMNQAVRSKLESTVAELSSSADSAYKSLREQMPEQTRGAASNIIGFIEKRASDLDGAKNLSSLEKMVVKKLSPINVGGNIRQPTYALIDDVRKEIGAAARQKGAFSDADTGLAKKLYQLIDEDQYLLAQTAGLGDEYKIAKILVKTRKGFEDDMVSLFGRQLDQSLVGKLESATMSLSKGDADKLAKILSAIPKEMRQYVTASALHTAFGKATQNGTLNFNTFSKWHDGLLNNKKAYSALMVNLPQESRKKLSDLYRVSSAINKAARERITTGRIQAVQQDLQGADNLLSNIYGIAKRASVGIPLEAVTSSIGLPGTGLASGIASALTKGKTNALKAADELISSPEFQRLAVETVSMGNNPSKSAVKAVLMSQSFRKFADEVKLPRDMGSREKLIVQSMQAQEQFKQENQ